MSNLNRYQENINALQSLKSVYSTAISGRDLYDWYMLQADVFYNMVLNLAPHVNPDDFAMAVSETYVDSIKQRIERAFRRSAHHFQRSRRNDCRALRLEGGAE